MESNSKKKINKNITGYVSTDMSLELHEKCGLKRSEKNVYA